MKPPRIPLYNLPDVILHAADTVVLRHEHYRAAKAGDIIAADRLVAEMADTMCIDQIHSMLSHYPYAELVSVHALESDGVNEIPAALGKLIAKRLQRKINDSIVQSNSVGHTKASGFHRLAPHSSSMISWGRAVHWRTSSASSIPAAAACSVRRY